MDSPVLLVSVLTRSKPLAELSIADWSLLISQARSSYLLARLAHHIESCGEHSNLPGQAQAHLLAASLMASRQTSSLEWEIKCLARELLAAGASVALLKGAAYAMLRLPAAQGRVFSDIDVLVPRKKLYEVETELMIHGWIGAPLDDHDQRYYRQWMHEIPPMRHRVRGVTVDIHHTILPETARVKVQTAALFERMQAIPGLDDFQTLCPVDMLLHSATHLFHEGEFTKGTRDLFDLDALLRDFGERVPGFWDDLPVRAASIGLARPLFYALRYTTRLLGTPVPSVVVARMKDFSPHPIVLRLVDACYERALRPMHRSCDVRGSNVARFLLYVRSHWIRMPLHLLIWHLGRKAWLRLFKTPDDVQQGPDAAAPVGQVPNQARHQQQ